MTNCIDRILEVLTNYFNERDDSRRGSAPRHKFCDLMMVSFLCALYCGDTAIDIEYFGQVKGDVLREFLDLPPRRMERRIPQNAHQ